MKLEEQVCSLDLAKKLKELGVKQESYFWWWTDRYGVGTDNNAHVQDHQPNNPKEGWRTCSAFTVAELGEMLPEEFEVDEVGHFITVSRGLRSSWTVGYRPNGSSWIRYMQEDLTEADARAKMLIYLLENKLITL